MAKTRTKSAGLVETLRYYYESDTPVAHRFRYALLAFDIVTILFVVATSFAPRSETLEKLDLVFGVIILADFLARLAISRHRLREFARPATWADIAAIASFLAPVTGEMVGFLRVLRTVRLLHTYELLARLRQDSRWFRRNEEVVLATVNLAVFLFIMTGIVYETQHARNPAIGNYIDALYFTVATLTTTGFGDITLMGTTGPPDLGGDHDPRRDAVPYALARSVAAAEGAFPLPDLRAHAPRRRRRALQGLRHGAANPRRGPMTRYHPL